MSNIYQIRSMTENDLSMVLAWRNHPEIRSFMLTQHEISISEHTRWFREASEDISKRLLIVESQDNPVGYVQFSNLKLWRIADWGFYICPKAKKGTGKKLGFSALRYAFEELKLNKVCGQVIASNKASINFHERLGFKREEEHCSEILVNNSLQTLIGFGLFANEWKAQVHEGFL